MLLLYVTGIEILNIPFHMASRRNLYLEELGLILIDIEQNNL